MNLRAGNNIGALRLVFALTVLFAHSQALSLAPPLHWLSHVTNSELAVQGFFILSGYLVVMSYVRSRSWWDYGLKRFRRIYPAYGAVIFGCAALGALVTTANLGTYGAEVGRYVFYNLLFLNFLHPTLPGMFAQNPMAAVNGALWTIKLEVMFYAVVPLIAWLCRGRARGVWLAAIYLGSLAYRYYFNHLAVVSGNAQYEELARQLPGQLCYFISGAALYYYFDWARARLAVLLPLAIAGYGLMLLTGISLFAPASIGVLVFAVAFGPYLGNAERFGDLSYGIYLWHFPIIQLLVAVGIYTAHPYLALLVSLLCTTGAAWLSWHLVERRFLRPSSHYIAAEQGEINESAARIKPIEN